jgi:hypothetical protein
MLAMAGMRVGFYRDVDAREALIEELQDVGSEIG